VPSQQVFLVLIKPTFAPSTPIDESQPLLFSRAHVGRHRFGHHRAAISCRMGCMVQEGDRM